MIFSNKNITQSVYFCQNTTKLLIAVISHFDDFDGRIFIRKTWGKPSPPSEIRFVVGKKKNENFPNALLLAEQLAYKDLIITTIEEDYYDLSLKTLASLTFFSSACPSATCLSKSDSDTIINISKLEKLCNKHKTIESIHGYCFKNGLVLRRSFISSKWNVPEYVFAPKNYPFYCRGGNYLFTKRSTIEKILTSLNFIGFFSSYNLQKMPEDVIFTGIAAEYANIKLRPNSRFIPCIDENGKDCLKHNPLPKPWISAMIGNIGQEILQNCVKHDRWENCVNNKLFRLN